MIRTIADLFRVLAGVPGFVGKVAYHAFPADKKVALPVILYEIARSNNYGADDKVYYPVNHIEVQLYTAGKEPATEEALETALANAGIFWEKTEAYLSEERCFQIIYEFEI